MTALRHTDIQLEQKSDLSGYLEGDGTGCRKPGEAMWPSGEISVPAEAQEGSLVGPEWRVGD